MFPVRVNKSLPEVERGRECVASPTVGVYQLGREGGNGEASCNSGPENNGKFLSSKTAGIGYAL